MVDSSEVELCVELDQPESDEAWLEAFSEIAFELETEDFLLTVDNDRLIASSKVVSVKKEEFISKGE